MSARFDRAARRLTPGLRLGAGLALLAAPGAAWPLDWSGLWRNADQRAFELMQGEAYAEAARLFDDQRWRAAALYRAGEYRAAAAAWSAMDDARAHYNRGNALARAGDLQAAAAAYETALERDPDPADARYNLELLREQMQGGGGGAGTGQQQDAGDAADERAGAGRRDPGGDPADRLDQESARGQDGGGEVGRPPADDAGSDSDGRQAEGSSGGQSAEQQSVEPDPVQAESPQRDPAPRDGEAGVSGRERPDSGDPVEQAAMEQWLRRIPDDPAGLLERKFKHQYQGRGRGDAEVREPW